MCSRFFTLLTILFTLATLSAAQPRRERGEIGDFTTLAHSVSGTVHILGPRTIFLENFNYDGNGPDTVLYFYPPGVAADPQGASGAVVVDLPRNSEFGDDQGRFQERPYMNENILVTLPEGRTTCDIGILTVWCRQARVLFSNITIPRSAFVNDGAAPCRPIGSAEIGRFTTMAHEVSGTVHILDPRTLYLENFNYDGRGPDTLLYFYAPGVAADANGGGSNIRLPQTVADSQGRFQMRRYINENFVVPLPEGVDACAIGTLSVWCREARVLFGTIPVTRDTFANNGQAPCTVISDDSGGLLLNPVEADLAAERGQVGDFITRAHGVSGTVHILSSNKIYLENFNYDGMGPDTVLYFYPVGVAVSATGGGTVIELTRNSQFGDNQGRFQMRRYVNEGILVTLPAGVTTCDMGALTVWCREARVLFAEIMIPRRAFVNNGAEPCASFGSAEIGDMETLAHEASGTVHVLDSKTIYLENFNYDGQGPDTLLYSYRPGQPVDPRGGGTFIPLPLGSRDSEGRFQMRRYTDEDIVVTLPRGMSTCDIGSLTVWCRQANVTFAQIPIPRTNFANNGAEPCRVIGDGSGGVLLNAPEFDNCMPLDDTLQLSWRVDNANARVRFRLCGCESQEAGVNQYMGFGLSGSDARTLMVGADPIITWVDSTSGTEQANAVDYSLTAYRPCNNGVGACPDTMDARGGCTNDVSDVIGTTSGGRQCVSFTRQMNTSDSVCDRVIDPTNQNQYIVWGIGRLLDETVQQHFTRANPSDAPIHLGRRPRDDCAHTQLVCRSCDPFENEQIMARVSTTFQARIGPAGSERGYMGITGRAGWGINWYINGTLIPELVVERGQTYTFMVEGGDDPNDASNYHPFYITDSIDGGRLRNSQQAQNSERVFAGIDENGDVTAVGPLCEYTETPNSETMRETCDAGLTQYVNSLAFSQTSLCRTNSGQPGKLVWTPDETTPDVVYYQCATHQNLGWKIVVQDSHAPVLQAVSLLVLVVSGLVGLMLL